MDDATRAPLDAATLRSRLRSHPFWSDVGTTQTTGSTNADVASLARAGAPEGLVRTTDLQTAGRGRLARSWTSPPAAGIAVSVLLRPVEVPRERWTWLPLLAGLAVSRTADRAGLSTGLKWPNDLLVEDRKLAGVLVEIATGAVDGAVVGIGLNVTNAADELPPGATSLALEGAGELDRHVLLATLLGDLFDAYAAWRDGAGEPTDLRATYLARSVTIGRTVEVTLPGGGTVRGLARTVDVEGRLVVAGPEGALALGAGDVVHVR